MTTLRHTAKDYLTPEQIQALQQRSAWRGWWAVVSIWGVIALCFAAVIIYPSVFTIVPAIIVLAGRQLACAILMHESAHRTLFPNRQMNDWVGQYLGAAAIFLDAPKYREHHLRHHRHTGTANDPDLRLAEGFPIARGSLRRKCLRDVLGLTGFKNLLGSVLMIAGLYKFTVAGDTHKLDLSQQSRWQTLRQVCWGLQPAITTHGVLLAVLWLSGAPWAYLLWLGALITPYPLFLRIRAIAEHALTDDPTDALNNARTTYAAWWTRWLWAPMCVNYHLEHHMLMSVPWYQLPAMHAQLKQAQAFQQPAAVAPNYRSVLKTVTHT